MGYRVVDPDEVEPSPDRPCEQRRLTAPAGLEHMAVNRYVAQPGEQIPSMYHAHEEQEEAFYVLSGTLHVETPDEEYVVPEGQLFAVDPGSFQRAYNPAGADGPLTVLALGAPQTSGDAYQYEPEE